DRRLHRALQPPVPRRAARLPDPRRGPPRAHPPGRLIKPGTCPMNRGRYNVMDAAAGLVATSRVSVEQRACPQVFPDEYSPLPRLWVELVAILEASWSD